MRSLRLTRRQSSYSGSVALWLPGIGAAVVGWWLGLDLSLRTTADLGSGLYALVLAASAPLPLIAVGCLYHDELHAALLPWPVSGGQHLRLGLRLFALGQWPWLVLLACSALAASRALPWPKQLLCLAFCLGCWVGNALIALAGAQLCAPIADTSRPGLIDLLEQAAGPFSSARHAPFFYLPALAFGLAMLSSGIAQEGALNPLLAQTLPVQPSAAQMALVMAPLGLGALLLALGDPAYQRHALRIIPQVQQESRMVYGGSPPPAEPPYGLWISRLLPRQVRAHYRKELREQGRASTGLWAWLALGFVAALIYGVSSGTPTRGAPVIGVVAVIWASTLPTRRTPRQLATSMLQTLPVNPPSAWLGRWIALLFVAAHAAAAAALSLGFRHGVETAGLVTLVALMASALATSFTQAHRTGARAPYVPAACLAIGLVALAWPRVGLVLLVIAATAGTAAGLRRGLHP